MMASNSNDRDFRKALDSANELQLTFLGGKTGKKFSVPIWFVKTENKVLLLPVGGTRSKWYRGVTKNPAIEIQVSGIHASREARPILDKKVIDEVMDKFRSKYGADDVERYYPGQDAAVELSI